jgi:hypothetical protein
MPNPDAEFMKYTMAKHWIYCGKIPPLMISQPQKHWPAYGYKSLHLLWGGPIAA